MKSFDVYLLPNGSYNAIKHGFSWPAFFFNWIWCFFIARLYGWGGVWLVIILVSGTFDRIADDGMASNSGTSLAMGISVVNFLVFVGIGIAFALNANDFRRRKYTQLGFTLVSEKVGALNSEGAIAKARQEKPLDSVINSPQTISKIKEKSPTPKSTKPSITSKPNMDESTWTKMGHSKVQELDAPDDHSGAGEQSTEVKEEMSQPNDNPVWSDEYNLLYEYDPVVKECHDELDNIDPELTHQFREEIVLDRKKATEIRDRLKMEHEKKLNPYSSDQLNRGLSEARSLGTNAEGEFTQIIKVMGEDIDVDDIVERLKLKFGAPKPPEKEVDDLSYWEIINRGQVYYLGKHHFKNRNDAIVNASKILIEFLQNASQKLLEEILTSNGFSIENRWLNESQVIETNGKLSIKLNNDELPNFIKANISPSDIRKCFDYLK